MTQAYKSALLLSIEYGDGIKGEAGVTIESKGRIAVQRDPLEVVRTVSVRLSTARAGSEEW